MAGHPTTPAVPRRGQRFNTLDEQLRQVQRQCEAEWLGFAGSPWSEEWRSYFDRSEEHARAQERWAGYIAAARDLVRAAEKARAYLATPGGYKGALFLLGPVLDDGAWTVAEDQLALDVGPLKAYSRRTVFVAGNAQGAFLKRGHRATLRELAVVSLLLGNVPMGVTRHNTVSEVIAAEERACAEVRARWPGMGDKLRRKRATKP